MIRFPLAGLTLILAAAGCSHAPANLPDNARACPEPRPQMCTMDYRPVIGLDQSGNTLGEYSNPCSGCAKEGVAYTVPVK
jgi:hypothetical protein